MYTTMTRQDFHDAFQSSDSYRDSFSYEWLDALFDYLEEYEDATDTRIEFDIVALACDYSEYPSSIEAVDAYTEDTPYLLDHDEIFTALPDGTEESIWQQELSERQEAKAREWLEYRTQVIPFDTWIIIQPTLSQSPIL
jgi:hypothetical protein